MTSTSTGSTATSTNTTRSLDDFFTFTSYPGLDPETCTQEYNCPGLDKGVYPNMRKMVLGISVTF